MAADTSDIARNAFMLKGAFARQGYDWWWHSFTGHHAQTGEPRAFFIEFFCCNPALGGQEPVLGQLPENRAQGVRPSYLMVKCGHWGHGARQLHRFFGWDDVSVGSGVPYWVAADDCLATETDLVGSVRLSDREAAAHPEWMSDAGSMLFDLRVNKRIAYNVGWGASAPLRDAEAFEMFWHAEGIKCDYAGSVWLDGEEYLVRPEDCYGYADKNWGGDFTSPWVWLASCDLVSERTGKRLANSAFEIGGGRPKVGPLALPRKLLGCFNYEGREFEFNFSKPWTGSQTRFDCYETASKLVWHVEQETFEALMVTDIECPKDEMLLVNYEAPTGEKRHNRLWNGGTGAGSVRLYEKNGLTRILLDEVHAENVGCEYGEYDAQGPYERTGVAAGQDGPRVYTSYVDGDVDERGGQQGENDA